MWLRALKVLSIVFLSFCNCTFIKKLFSYPDKAKTNYIVDKDNRICIYHGVNVSNYSKHGPGFLPWQTKEDFARLKDWGFNLVRYLVFWDAIEPTQGTYNIGYIQSTLERLRWLEELGIDVVIDIHQDLYCKKFTGNGFPVWSAGDLPFKERSPWNLNYTEPAVIDSYNRFWKNEELKAHYIDMLKFVLKNVDSLKNVIGIDVMNEPFPGTILGFEKSTLSKFYSDIQTMVKQNNFKTKMFFEPMMITSSGIPSTLSFKPQPSCVYYPHYYDVFCHESLPYKKINSMILKRAMMIKYKEAQDMGVSLLFGEFGAGYMIPNFPKYLKDFVAINNEYLTGWTYYTYDKISYSGYGLINDDGSLREQLQYLVTVYPQKIAGKGPSVEYTDNSFSLNYTTIPGTTEIFIPANLNNLKISVNGGIIQNSYIGNVFQYENDSKETQSILISWGL